jgi:hypothetical protein
VTDATAASKDRNNPIFCAVSDATAASDTENPRSCKQTINLQRLYNHDETATKFGPKYSQYFYI